MSANVGQSRPRYFHTVCLQPFLFPRDCKPLASPRAAEMSSSAGLDALAAVEDKVAEPQKGEAPTAPPTAAPAGKEMTCSMCRRSFPTAAPGRAKGKQWACRHCLSLQTMLYRKLGPMEHQDWTQESKANFFRRAADKNLAGRDSPVVRTLLTDCLTVRHLEERGAEVNAESLPLSVWVTKGYSEDAVKQFPAEECPKLGQLYSIPVRKDTWRDVHSKLTSEVLVKERAVKKRKGDKKSPKEDVWDVVEVAEAAPAQPNKKVKVEQDPNKAKACEEKAKQRAEAQAEKANKVQETLAAKSLPVWMRVCQGCEMALAKAKSLHVDVGPQFTEPVEEALTKCKPWLQAASDMVSVANKTAKGVQLQPLPFSAEEVQTHSKAAFTVLKDLKDEMSRINKTERLRSKAAKDEKKRQKENRRTSA